MRFGLSGPAWVGWVNVAAGWLVPYLLGIAWALGSLRGRRVPALMLAGVVSYMLNPAALGLRPGHHVLTLQGMLITTTASFHS